MGYWLSLAVLYLLSLVVPLPLLSSSLPPTPSLRDTSSAAQMARRKQGLPVGRPPSHAPGSHRRSAGVAPETRPRTSPQVKRPRTAPDGAPTPRARSTSRLRTGSRRERLGGLTGKGHDITAGPPTRTRRRGRGGANTDSGRRAGRWTWTVDMDAGHAH
jgi:hypothetical protein